MKRKKILSLILTVCLAVSIISMPAFAAESDSKGLEQAIVTMKQVVVIPDNYKDFTHSSSQYDIGDQKVTVWNLEWENSDDNNGYISASIDENGDVLTYNKYSPSENSNGLAKITKEDAQKSVEDFLNKVIPSYSNQMKEIDVNSNNPSSDQYNFTYQQFVDNAPVDFNRVEINVSKSTGEVTSYTGLNPGAKMSDYPSTNSVINLNTAEKSYIDKLGVHLKYYSSYDYKEKKLNVFPGYSVDDNKFNAIDGKTGDVISLLNQDKIYKYKNNEASDMTNTASSAIQNSNQKLTQEEIDAISNISEFITKEKASDIIKESIDTTNFDMTINDSSLSKDRINENYIWEIGFKDGYGKVDAKTGELLSFYFYNNKDGNQNMSKSDAQSMAEQFLKKAAEEKYSQTQYEDNNNLKFKDISQDGNIYSFNFVRQVNGIDFDNNSLEVEIDKTTGKIIEYQNRWYDNVTFPDISQAMTKEAAFNKINEYGDFGLEYNLVDNDKVALVYNFRNLKGNYIINPISGVRIDLEGKTYKDNKLPEYSDISGHPCEKIVKELLENGYYIPGEKFNPDSNITQISFLKYLYSPEQSSYSDDDFYEMLINRGIVQKDEKNPDSLLSNQDIAKIIVRYLGYDKVASHPEIFKNPFNDSIEYQYQGYAAICYSFGIMKGDNNGNFNGTSKVSNAESAQIIYNILKQSQSAK